ncbi:MAG: DUF4445 domain-containing protein [Bdellovibrionales bacterium]|nr:DUF4445 domain-containing protein [Bdellovibrionales bacterium]
MPFKVGLKTVDRQWEFRVALAGPTLLDLMNGQEIPIKSSCLGKGICHQCRVQIQSGFQPPSSADKKAFSSSELADGWRLSCTLRPKSVVDAFFPQAYVFTESIKVNRSPKSDWQYVVDLGTTGIEILALDSEGIWAECKALNRLVLYGSDIMTRVECSQKKGVEFLHKKLFLQLGQLHGKMVEGLSTDFHFVKKWTISGNSVMSAIATNHSLESLAVAPYEPESLSGQVISSEYGEIETLPLLHSFIGGDLTAAVYSKWLQNRKLLESPRWVLVDVGTNSEILFWDGQRLFVSSTPAGPAFEGANISIGMRAEAGAIVDPEYQPDSKCWKFSILGGDLPKGLCGSALIDMVAQAVTHGLVAEDGEVLLPEQMRLTDRLQLSQADIREFQLAKSAIRTGIDLVMTQSEQAPEELLLAGNFGEHLHHKNCQQLGLFPELPTKVIGNSSLRGVLDWSQTGSDLHQEFCEWLEQVKSPIELALRAEFQDQFIKNMSLG